VEALRELETERQRLDLGVKARSATCDRAKPRRALHRQAKDWRAILRRHADKAATESAPQPEPFDNLGRRRQARWIEAAAKRDAEKAAWLNRDPGAVAADLRRLHELLFDRARWKFAYTMSDNRIPIPCEKPGNRMTTSSGSSRRIRTIGDREKFPPSGPAARWYRVYHANCPPTGTPCIFWTMNWDIGDLSWGWGD
jgi:hypothetical protein